MSIDLSSYNPKDRKIIADNPEKSAYDLLALGLSQKGYERYAASIVPQDTANKGAEPGSTIEPVEVVATEVQPVVSGPVIVENEQPLTPASVTAPAKPAPAKPALSSAPVGQKMTVKVYNKKTGRAVIMNSTIARSLVANHPEQYSII